MTETYQFESKRLQSAEGQHWRLRRDGLLMSHGDVLAAWRDDPDFCLWFDAYLGQVDFPAYFWEMPPLNRAALDQPFECVLIPAPELEGVVADRESFAEYFRYAQGHICHFDNLGGDALLVVPCPHGPGAEYSHLAKFTRQAPLELRLQLWAALAKVLLERLGDEPCWLSTCGTGVYWLHLRLDSRPKYYSFAPYRQWPQ